VYQNGGNFIISMDVDQSGGNFVTSMYVYQNGGNFITKNGWSYKVQDLERNIQAGYRTGDPDLHKI
jgi:hypothetical protein